MKVYCYKHKEPVEVVYMNLASLEKVHDKIDATLSCGCKISITQIDSWDGIYHYHYTTPRDKPNGKDTKRILCKNCGNLVLESQEYCDKCRVKIIKT